MNCDNCNKNITDLTGVWIGQSDNFICELCFYEEEGRDTEISNLQVKYHKELTE